MEAEVRFTIPELDAGELAGATAVVVDVLRATTTVVTALSAGARAIIPAASTEDALRLVQSLGREDTLLCGERKGLRIEGYDLGNSPRDFTAEVVRGKRLVMNTTNGTRTFLAVEAADRVLAAAFLNMTAVVEAVAHGGSERLLVACAGREDAFALEDALCAGVLLLRLRERGVPLVLDDAARAAVALAEVREPDADFLASTAGGRDLVEAGLGEDLPFCARLDGETVVPVLRERSLVALDPGGR